MKSNNLCNIKASIIVFSPSGHTLQAAKILKKAFEKKGISTQLINITKNPNYLDEGSIRQQLEKDIEEKNEILASNKKLKDEAEKELQNIKKSDQYNKFLKLR